MQACLLQLVEWVQDVYGGGFTLHMHAILFSDKTHCMQDIVNHLLQHRKFYISSAPSTWLGACRRVV